MQSATAMQRAAFVIGGYGFLGQHLVARLLGGGWRVGVIDPSAPAEGETPFGGPGVTVHSVRSSVDQASWLELERALGSPEQVFHLGGSGSVGAAERDPARDRELTVESTRLLAERARAAAARLVLVSSAAVYGDQGAQPLAESLPHAPVSVYGRHKAAAEDVAL